MYIFSETWGKWISGVVSGEHGRPDRLIGNIWKDKAKEFSHAEFDRLTKANPDLKLALVSSS